MQKQLEQAYTPAKSSTAKGGKNGQSLVPPVYDVATPGAMPIQRKKKEEDDLKKKKPVQRKAKEEDLKKKKPLQRKKKDEEDLSKKKPLQRKAQPGDSSILIDAPDSPLEKEADAVAEQVVRRMSMPGSAERKPVRFSAGSISRTAVGGGAGALYAPAHVASELETSRGQGQALPESVRTDMEDVIGTDLSGVRIHTDAKAAELSEAVNAQAFTYGEDVYFNTGKYEPGGWEGRRLLGHELGHVGQITSTSNLDLMRVEKSEGKLPIDTELEEIQSIEHVVEIGEKCSWALKMVEIAEIIGFLHLPLALSAFLTPFTAVFSLVFILAGLGAAAKNRALVSKFWGSYFALSVIEDYIKNNKLSPWPLPNEEIFKSVENKNNGEVYRVTWDTNIKENTKEGVDYIVNSLNDTMSAVAWRLKEINQSSINPLSEVEFERVLITILSSLASISVTETKNKLDLIIAELREESGHNAIKERIEKNNLKAKNNKEM